MHAMDWGILLGMVFTDRPRKVAGGGGGCLGESTQGVEASEGEGALIPRICCVGICVSVFRVFLSSLINPFSLRRGVYQARHLT